MDEGRHSPVKQFSTSFRQLLRADLAHRLYDPSLLHTHPGSTTLPPAFFKHVDKHVDKPDHGSARWAAGEAALGAPPPPSSYKLLSSDYDWLDNPNLASKARSRQQQEEDAKPLPAPPLELQQSNFLARARIVLVKLRKQVDECVASCLASAASGLLLGEQQGAAAQSLGHQVAGAGQSSQGSPWGTVGGTLPRLPPTPQAPAQPAVQAAPSPKMSSAWAAACLAQEGMAAGRQAGSGQPGQGQPQAAHRAAGGGLGLGHPELDRAAKQCEAKLAEMFEDCLEDLMEQLWGALQYAGSARSQVAVLANAMASRDSELEEVAQRRLAGAEAQVVALQAKLLARQAEEESERLRWQAALLTSQAKVEHLAKSCSALEQQLQEREALRGQVDALRAALSAAEGDKARAVQDALASSQHTVEQLRDMAQAAQARMLERDAALAAARSHAAEQAALLDTACQRRDHEVAAARKLEATVAELVAVLGADAGLSVRQWLAVTEAAKGSGLQPGEALDGECGLAKALLAAARQRGAVLAIAALKPALPASMPDYEPAGDPGISGQPAPKQQGLQALKSSGHLKEAMPELWHHLLRAPLQQHMTLAQLNKHILELYAVKRAADDAADAAGQPRQGLHAAVYKHYLAESNSVEACETKVVALIHGLRAHSAKSERALLFSQFLALRGPVLPEPGLLVYQAFSSALRAQPPEGQPAVVEDAGGAAWVHLSRWRPLVMGPLGASCWDGDTMRTIIKRVGELKTEPARSKPHFGMHDLDSVLHCIMDAWVAFWHDQLPLRLAACYKEHNLAGNGVFSFYEFKDMATNVNQQTSVTPAFALDLMHQCLAESAATARKAPGQMRGSITEAAFVQVCIKHRLLGCPPQMAGGVETQRINMAVRLFASLVDLFVTDVQEEGLQTVASGRLTAEVRVLEQRLREAESAGLDSDAVADAWSALSVITRMLLEVRADFVRKRKAAREAAAAAASAREASLQDAVAAASREAEEALKKRAEAEAAAALALAKATEGAATTDGEDQLGEGSSPTASLASSPSLSRCGERSGSPSPVKSALPGDSPRSPSPLDPQREAADEAEQLRAQLAQLARRAEAAEAKLVAQRQQIIQHEAALERLKQANARRARQAGRRAEAAAQLPNLHLGSLPPWLDVASGALPLELREAIGQLLQVAGFMHGVAGGLGLRSPTLTATLAQPLPNASHQETAGASSWGASGSQSARHSSVTGSGSEFSLRPFSAQQRGPSPLQRLQPLQPLQPSPEDHEAEGQALLAELSEGSAREEGDLEAADIPLCPAPTFAPGLDAAPRSASDAHLLLPSHLRAVPGASAGSWTAAVPSAAAAAGKGRMARHSVASGAADDVGLGSPSKTTAGRTEGLAGPRIAARGRARGGSGVLMGRLSRGSATEDEGATAAWGQRGGMLRGLTPLPALLAQVSALAQAAAASGQVNQSSFFEGASEGAAWVAQLPASLAAAAGEGADQDSGLSETPCLEGEEEGAAGEGCGEQGEAADTQGRLQGLSASPLAPSKAAGSGGGSSARLAASGPLLFNLRRATASPQPSMDGSGMGGDLGQGGRATYDGSSGSLTAASGQDRIPAITRAGSHRGKVCGSGQSMLFGGGGRGPKAATALHTRLAGAEADEQGGLLQAACPPLSAPGPTHASRGPPAEPHSLPLAVLLQLCGQVARHALQAAHLAAAAQAQADLHLAEAAQASAAAQAELHAAMQRAALAGPPLSVIEAAARGQTPRDVCVQAGGSSSPPSAPASPLAHSPSQSAGSAPPSAQPSTAPASLPAPPAAKAPVPVLPLMFMPAKRPASPAEMRPLSASWHYQPSRASGVSAGARGLLHQDTTGQAASPMPSHRGPRGAVPAAAAAAVATVVGPEGGSGGAGAGTDSGLALEERGEVEGQAGGQASSSPAAWGRGLPSDLPSVPSSPAAAPRSLQADDSLHSSRRTPGGAVQPPVLSQAQAQLPSEPGQGPQGAREQEVHGVELGGEVAVSQLDTSWLLCRCFRLAETEIEELGWGIMNAVHAAGGFPVISTEGHVYDAQGHLLAPSHPAHSLPDVASQTEALRRLYICTAGLVVSQHSRGVMLQRLQADLDRRFKSMQAAAKRVLARHQLVTQAQSWLGANLLRLAGCQVHCELLTSSLAAIADHVTSAAAAVASLPPLLPPPPCPPAPPPAAAAPQQPPPLQPRAAPLTVHRHPATQPKLQEHPVLGAALDQPGPPPAPAQLSQPGTALQQPAAAASPSPDPSTAYTAQPALDTAAVMAAVAASQASLAAAAPSLQAAHHSLQQLHTALQAWMPPDTLQPEPLHIPPGPHPTTSTASATNSGDVAPGGSSLAGVRDLLQQLHSTVQGSQEDAQSANLLLDLQPRDLFQQLQPSHEQPAAPPLNISDLLQASSDRRPDPNTQPLSSSLMDLTQAAAASLTGASQGQLRQYPAQGTPAATPALEHSREEEGEAEEEEEEEGDWVTRSLHQAGGPGLLQWLDLALMAAQHQAASALPPGAPLVTLSASLLARSQMAPPRYLGQPEAGGLHRGGGRHLYQGRPLEPAVVPARYERRPFTARRYVEAVQEQGAARASQLAHHPQLGNQANAARWAAHEAHIRALLFQHSRGNALANHPIAAPGHAQGAGGIRRPWAWWQPGPAMYSVPAVWEQNMTQAPGVERNVSSLPAQLARAAADAAARGSAGAARLSPAQPERAMSKLARTRGLSPELSGWGDSSNGRGAMQAPAVGVLAADVLPQPAARGGGGGALRASIPATSSLLQPGVRVDSSGNVVNIQARR